MERQVDDKEGLLDRFFAEVRAVSLAEKSAIDFDPGAISTIVTDPALQARFRHRFKTEVQNVETRDLVLAYLAALADEEQELADCAGADAEGLDKYVGRVGIGATLAGCAAIAATGGLAAVIFRRGVGGNSCRWDRQ
jgi:hypothetical protein